MNVPAKFLMVSMATFIALTSNAMAVTVRGLSDTSEITRQQDHKSRKFDRVYDRLERMKSNGKDRNVRFDSNVRKLKRTEAEMRVLGDHRAANVDRYNIPEFAEDARGSARVSRESSESHDSQSSYRSRDFRGSSESHDSRSGRSGYHGSHLDSSDGENVGRAATVTVGNATFLLSDYQSLIECEAEKCKQADGPCTVEVPATPVQPEQPPVVVEPKPPFKPAPSEPRQPIRVKKDFKPAPSESRQPIRVKQDPKPTPEICTVKAECPPPVVVVVLPELEVCTPSAGEVICPVDPVKEEPKDDLASVKAKYKNREKAKDWVLTDTGIKKVKRKLYVKVKLKGEMDPADAQRIMDAAQLIKLNDLKDKGIMADSLVTSAPLSGNNPKSARGSSNAN